MSEKITYLESLFDLLEEDLDGPAAGIQITDAACGPLQVIGDENHDDGFAIDFDFRFEASQACRILVSAGGNLEGDLVVAQNIAFTPALAFAADTVGHVVLGPGDPENAAQSHLEQMVEVDVSLVKDRDLAGLQGGTERSHAPAVVMCRFLDHREAWKEGLQIEPQVHFGRRFATPMLGPIHAVSDQRDGRGVDRVDRTFELAGQLAVTPRGSEAFVSFLQRTEDLPEERFHHVAVAVFVRMGKAIAARWSRPANPAEFGLVVAQTIAHVVEPYRMGEVAIKQTHDMAPRRKRATLTLHPILVRKLSDHPGRDGLAKLIKHADAVLGWFWFFIHTGFLGRKPARANHFFLPQPLIPVGWL